MDTAEKKIRLRVSECDAENRWRVGAMMIEMQEAAGMHSTLLGCGREKLVERGIAWVIVRMDLRILRYPSAGETVTVRTWRRPTRHLFFPRYFEILDGEGAQVAVASSLWVLMDLNTRKSVPAGMLPTALPDSSEMPEPMPLPPGIPNVEGPEKRIAYEPVYTDLDANHHVNNTKYADWLCNMLGVETMTEHPPEEVIIHFDSEVRPGQRVEMSLKQDGLRYQLTGNVDERAAFRIGGTLKP